jgi:hypothetical protein
MAQHTVTLSDDQETALTQMGITDVEAYVKELCDAHISQKLDDDWAAKSDAEKKTLLES